MDAISVKGREPISEKEMYEMYDVDENFRETERVVHNNRTTTMKNKEGEVLQALNHQTKLFLKPKYDSYVPEWSVEIMKTLLQEQGVEEKRHPQFRQDINSRRDKGNTLGGIMWTDFHIDQRDHKTSTLNARIKNVNERTARVLERVMKFDPDQLVICNLGDMFETDGRYRTTSGKVHLQNTVQEKDIFKYMIERTIKALEQIRATGLPIEYKVVSGNHDHLTMQHYGTAMEYYFGDSMKVSTDENRGYIQWGETLIAIGHGDNEKPANFLQLVTDEFLTKFRKKISNIYGYIGNQHQLIVSQNGPMLIKNLLAPNPKSDRTKAKGYDMRQGMHGFVWDKKDGEVAEVRG